MSKKIFLAANGCTGFFSAFGEIYDPFDGWTANLVKGGPGTGKSTFMRNIAKRYEEQNEEVIYCFCSSDPDSLDGIIIPNKKIVFLDSTAPHIVEPKLVGVCEQIVDTGAFWDREKLIENKDKIIELSVKNKLFHAAAGRYLSAAGQIYKDNMRMVLNCLSQKRLNEFAYKKIKKYLKFKGSNNKNKTFFLTGITPKGVISFPETVYENYQDIIVIEDKFGICSDIILRRISADLRSAGYTVFEGKSPFFADTKTEHLLVPQLSLAFVSENEYIKFPKNLKRVHCHRFIDKGKYAACRNKIFFNRRIAKELTLAAVNELKKAKAVHDKIEKCYVEAMDFSAFKKWSQEFNI